MTVPGNSLLCRLWRTFWTIWKSKIDFAKVNTSSCSNLFSLFLTMITVRWRLYQARAWIRYHPSSWDWCTLPLRYLWTGFYRSELVCWRSSSIIFFLNWFFSLRSFQENQICLWVNISRESSTIRLPHRSWTRQKVGTREWASAENRWKLAYIILVELLAYLFFSLRLSVGSRPKIFYSLSQQLEELD